MEKANSGDKREFNRWQIPQFSEFKKFWLNRTYRSSDDFTFTYISSISVPCLITNSLEKFGGLIPN